VAPLKAEQPTYTLQLLLDPFKSKVLYTLQLQRGPEARASLHETLTMILYENMKAIEHVLLDPICVLSHLMCAYKHCNIKLSLYYWTHWSCWWIYHFKNTGLTRFFIITPRHTGRLKKQTWVEKTSTRALYGHMRQNAYNQNLKWTFEDLLPCHCYAIKTKNTTIRQQVLQPASAGTGSDLSKLRKACQGLHGHGLAPGP